jgi:galactokinase
MLIENLKNKFKELFGQDATPYRAPGRVNLIGEHTDYNDGFVFPAAIDRFTCALVAARADRRVAVFSENLHDRVEFDLDGPTPAPSPHWSSYIRGVARALEETGHHVAGANLLIAGDVPIGAGLSSSASLEIAAGYALLANSAAVPAPRELATIAQRAENDFVGIRCGIMDQLASACGVENHALLIDCRSLEVRAYPVPANVKLVICNSMVPRELSGSEYNARRADCEAGVRALASHLPGVRALRDVTLDQLERYRSAMSETVYRRCRHVITENARTLQAAEALEQKQFGTLRELMGASHRSLRDDYQVSCAEVDLLVELADRVTGVYGARMTGAGFGGCTINLVESASVAEFEPKVALEYERQTGRKPEIYICHAADGAGPAD